MTDIRDASDIRALFFSGAFAIDGFEISGRWQRSTVPVKFNGAIGPNEFYVNSDNQVLAVGKGGVDFVRIPDEGKP